MAKTYHIFISHSWAYSDSYENLVGLLEKDPSFSYIDYSVPKDDPIHNAGTDKELYSAIKEQIARASVVIIDRKSTRLNSSHTDSSRMPSSA